MTETDTIPAWMPCPDCDEHWCNIHGMHTHECDCPEIDEWESDPYSPNDLAQTRSAGD